MISVRISDYLTWLALTALHVWASGDVPCHKNSRIVDQNIQAFRCIWRLEITGDQPEFGVGG